MASNNDTQNPRTDPRLPNPANMQEDPRIDPRIKSMFADFKTLPHSEEVQYETREDLVRARNATRHDPMEQLGLNAPRPSGEVRALWSKEGLEITDTDITSQPDNNAIKMRLTRSSSNEGALPLVYYIHGGGMASGSIDDPMYKCIDRMLARHFGVAVMMVDFRNSTTPSSTPDLSPFPGGLNDCYSGLCWVHDHADDLGIDRAQVCVAGESGGGNLTIAVALKALREGSQAELLPKGFFSMCPYIAGSWPQEVTHEGALGDSHLDSVNNGLFLSMGGGNGALAYGQDAYDRKDILAWPGFATRDDLRGLCRCVISVNECDPLRDEGIAFYRTAISAGVDAQCRQVMGTVHGGDLMMSVVPSITMATLRCIADFVKSDSFSPSVSSPS